MANQITVLLDPAQMPARTQDQTTFDSNMGNLAANLPTLGAQINLVSATMNAYSAGTAYAIPFTFDTATADADPGAGKVRFDNATQSATTTLRLDLVGSNGVDYTTLLDSFDASTSVVKGAIRIEKAADPTKFIAFNVTGRAAPAGYRNIAVSYVGISAANPFANGDALILKFQRTGDKGDTGPTYVFPTLRVRDERASATAGDAAVTAGVQTRVLNTVKKNTITGASLATNRATLPAGTYKISGSASAYAVGSHQAYLYNVTGAATLVVGTSESSSQSSTRSKIEGEFTLAVSSALELRHYTQIGTGSASLGRGTAAGQGEVFSELVFEKVA